LLGIRLKVRPPPFPLHMSLLPPLLSTDFTFSLFFMFFPFCNWVCNQD
jgi:hypothetical protein